MVALLSCHYTSSQEEDCQTLFQMLTQESESMTYMKSNPSHSSLWLVLGDLNFLIALRKGVRNTQHPMSNFISFDRLSSQQKIFIT